MAASESNNTNFDDFRRYYSGEMSHIEQYNLEKRMLQDPFLADAYEGYVNAGMDHVDEGRTLKDLRETLEGRVKSREKRDRPLWGYAAAASVLFLVGWFFYVNRGWERQRYSSFDLATGATNKRDSSGLRPSGAFEPTHKSRTEVAVTQKLALRSDIRRRLDSSDVKSDQDRLAFNESLSVEKLETGQEVKTINVQPTVQPETTGTQHVADSTHISKKNDFIASGPAALSLSSKAIRTTNSQSTLKYDFVVQGRVVDAQGRGFPGVAIMLPFSGTETLTDSLGKFSIRAPKADSLQLKAIGYRPKSVVVTQEDLGMIVLDQDSDRLSEVVVVGYGKPPMKLDGLRQKINASPTVGWGRYNLYIAQAAKNELRNGGVKVTFTVNADGTLSDFKAKGNRNLVDVAIRIIREGPAWEPGKKGARKIASVVTIPVSFD
jgi:hypothetical protein